MHHWNHRVVEKDTKWGSFEYSIKEFYYNSDGEIEGWTENDVRPWGSDIDELREVLTWMLESLDKPVILQTELDAIIERHRDSPPQDDTELDELISRWEEDGGGSQG